MNEYKDLNKYILEGMISDELKKQQDESFEILNEEGKPTVSYSPRVQNPNAIHRLIAESLLECCPPTEGGVANYSTGVIQENPKYKQTRILTSSIQDLLYKLDRTYDKPDPELQGILENALIPLIKALTQKLSDLWKETPQPTTQPTSAPAPAQPTTVVTPEPILALSFAQGESIKSPQGTEYIIEQVNDKLLILKEKATGKKTSVDKDIAKKWKNK